MGEMCAPRLHRLGERAPAAFAEQASLRVLADSKR